MGKGAALLTGMTSAAKTCNWAITMDADGQHLPEDAIRLMRPIQDICHSRDLQKYCTDFYRVWKRNNNDRSVCFRPIVVGKRDGMEILLFPGQVGLVDIFQISEYGFPGVPGLWILKVAFEYIPFRRSLTLM